MVFSLVVEFVRGKFVAMPASNQGSDCKDSPSISLLVGVFSPTRLKNMHVRQIGSWNPNYRGETKQTLVSTTTSTPWKLMFGRWFISFWGVKRPGSERFCSSFQGGEFRSKQHIPKILAHWWWSSKKSHRKKSILEHKHLCSIKPSTKSQNPWRRWPHCPHIFRQATKKKKHRILAAHR